MGPRPPCVGGDRGVPAPKVDASCLTLEVLCWFLVGSRVGASEGWRMPSRGNCSCGSSGASTRSLPVRSGCTGGSGGESRDGVGDTSTPPLEGGGLGSLVVLPRGEAAAAPGAGRASSSASSPKRGGSAEGCLGERSELEELVCLRRALRRGLGGRATVPPAWRSPGDGALLLTLSEAALLGERGGVARGAGLRARWPGWPSAEPGRCGRFPSASGCGLSWRVLASLWRGEARG